MAKVIKNNGKQVQAWELGKNTDMELQLREEGKIVYTDNVEYELFSQEAKSGSGEKANAGDFFKVDKAGYPYPNKSDWFLANHVTSAPTPTSSCRSLWMHGKRRNLSLRKSIS